jgi:asparagine synthase (glutamine-hydrolysing)
MCGLAAFFEAGRSFAEPLLDAVDRDLFHRGPDSGGRLTEPGCALVFRRLAILDPTAASDQPMTDPTGQLTLIFNGEIYNYRDLQRELCSAGVTLRTKGDTETILEGYRLWGSAVFAKLEGMFALVLIDRRNGIAIAARDPFGIKPLYMTRRGRFTGFASEMRPLRRFVDTLPDPAALPELLTFRYAAGRLSNLSAIELIPGGVMVELQLADGSLRERRFDDPFADFSAEAMTAAEAEARAEEALVRSIETHLQSDVGFSVQLSGGVDSSLVTTIAANKIPHRLRSYGISLGDLPQDESRWRATVIAQTKVGNDDILVRGTDYADALPQAVTAMEGPTAHTGCPMLMLLCRKIRTTDRVVLTGEGADEFFGGYARYRHWAALRRQARFANAVPDFAWPLLGRYESLQRYAGHDPAYYAAVYHNHRTIAALFPDLRFGPGARAKIGERFADFRDRMMAADQSAYLSSLLMRQDKMSMASSVEARVPFTHRPLARVLNAIPRDIRVPGGTTKPLLKRIAERYLPHDLIHRRKVGLTIPVTDWLADSTGLGRYLEMLEQPDSKLASYGHRRGIGRLVSEFRRAPSNDQSGTLLALINVELWLRSLGEQLGSEARASLSI